MRRLVLLAIVATALVVAFLFGGDERRPAVVELIALSLIAFVWVGISERAKRSADVPFEGKERK